MSDIANELYNSGQAFLYVFVDPKANLNATIQQKRVEQLTRLNEMYQADKTYSPLQMIEILRQGIVAKYNKSPNTILQIIYDNAIRINQISGPTTGLTYDAETSQYYDGSGNAFKTNSAGAIISKNGQTSDLSIQTPATLDNICVGSPASGSTFWTDVASVIKWVVDLFQSLGITKPANTFSNYSPGSTDWSKLNTGSNLSTAGFGDYIPYVVGAGILYYLVTGASKKTSKK